MVSWSCNWTNCLICMGARISGAGTDTIIIEGVDSLELYKLALKGGITLAPGYLFSATNQFPDFIRLNAADWSYQTERAMERLGEMIEELMPRR